MNESLSATAGAGGIRVDAYALRLDASIITDSLHTAKRRLPVRAGFCQKRTPLWLAIAMPIPALYVASFGPACWIGSRTGIGIDSPLVEAVYSPIAWALNSNSLPRRIDAPYREYLEWWIRIGGVTLRRIDATGGEKIPEVEHT